MWTPLENDYLLVRIERDEHFILNILPKLDDTFFAVLLPEVVFGKYDLSSDNKQKHYCICQRPCFESMIACDKLGCDVEWYHYVWCQSLEHQKGHGYALNIKGIALIKPEASLWNILMAYNKIDANRYLTDPNKLLIFNIGKYRLRSLCIG